MKVNIELDQLIRLIGMFAQEAKDEIRIKMGEKADGAIVGVAFLFDYLRASLSGLEEYDLSPEPHERLVMGAVERFCSGWCMCSREVAPGAHERCQECTLMPFTAGAVEKAVERAMGES
jgi:hypothetical protein